MKKEDWNNEILLHQLYFDEIEVNKEMKLNLSMTIEDVPEFIKTHLYIVKANNGNQTFRPYLDRLIELRNLIEKQKSQSLNEIRKEIKNQQNKNGKINN
jgi:uncharacterized transporter YbjL